MRESMLLNQTAIYALRSMTVLARLAPGEAITAQDLATRTSVPVHYLGKVMRKLVLGGLVRSQKGHGGGFSLNRAPDRIKFAEILEATNVVASPGKCAFSFERCDDSSPCPIHGAWSELQEGVQRWAEGHTLDCVRRNMP